MRAVSYSDRQANKLLILLLIAYILSFIDRNIMSVLIGPIRQDFDISDFQYSLLHGFAFSMFYIALGLPIARWADRYPRLNIISIGVGLWSLMTCLCGFTKGFMSLFLTRIGVGVGEAALSPPAVSILSDIFTPEKLPKATAIYSLGITLGGGLAYILGSFIYNFFKAFAPIDLGFLGEMQAWQVTFIVVGVPGFLIALAIRLMPEPVRRNAAQADGQAAADVPSIREVGRYFANHWRIYLGIMGSMSLMSVLGYGVMAWYPEMLIRVYGVERSVAGGQFGVVFIIAGSVGALIGGWICSALIKKGMVDAPVRIILFVALLWGIPSAWGPLSGDAGTASLMAWFIVLFLNSYFGVGVTAVSLVTPNEMRAQATAVLFFFCNLFGLAFGPTAVAILTDFIFGSDGALNLSLGFLPAIVLPPSLVLAYLALRPYRELMLAQGD